MASYASREMALLFPTVRVQRTGGCMRSVATVLITAVVLASGIVPVAAAQAQLGLTVPRLPRLS